MPRIKKLNEKDVLDTKSDVKVEATEELDKVLNPKVEEAVEEVAEDEVPEVEVKEVPIEKKEKLVKIKMKKTHRCCIAGEWYYLEKGEVYEVSPDVKRILNKSELLAPL